MINRTASGILASMTFLCLMKTATVSVADTNRIVKNREND